MLDSIAYALGGEKLVPSQPIRVGEETAKVTIELDDHIVTRRFYRKKVEDVPGASDAIMVWGATKSVLAVTNKEGAKYPAPQVLLDKLYGKLTFDPLAFNRETASRQLEILRQLINLDFSGLNEDRKVVFDRRTMAKKTLAIKEARLGNRHTNAPDALIPIDKISAKIKKGQEAREVAEKASGKVRENAEIQAKTKRALESEEQLVTDLQARLDASRLRIQCQADELKALQEASKLLAKTEQKAKKAVPDFEELDALLRDTDAKNEAVRENQAYDIRAMGVLEGTEAIEVDTKAIYAIDQKKADALLAAKFPVEGLGLTDDGITFEGLPLAEVASSVQLRVSIAIGIALNPTLKILLIRNGNLLDDDSLKLVAQQAEKADAQVWVEYVTASAEGVSVMLEDGHIQEG